MALNENDKIVIELGAITAMSVVGAIQLATRHPAYNGPSRGFAEGFARELQRRLNEINPNWGAIIEMGWNPDFDL